jgi:predicted nucleotidyltransferase
VNRAAVVTLLKRHQAELVALGVVSLSLIGSTARGEETAASDIDLVVRLTPGKRGFAHLERLDRVKERLVGILGCAVDLIEEPSPSQRIQRAIEQDRVLAF